MAPLQRWEERSLPPGPGSQGALRALEGHANDVAPRRPPETRPGVLNHMRTPKQLKVAVKTRVERGRVSPVARQVFDERLTYLSWRSLRHLEKAVRDASRIPGDFIECGVALGGSGIVIASLMPEGRTFHGYDVFGMIPPTTEKDDEKSRQRYEIISGGKSKGIRGDDYYGYMPDLLERVEESFGRHGLNGQVAFHKGLFEDTLKLDGPVSFAHLDCDWYESVKVCLERIYPVLGSGGLIISDDYHNYGGAREAVDEFLAKEPGLEIAHMSRGRPDRTTSIVLRKR